jgi:anti-sigma regulatory factor (Ser/Thr protein kinase)
VSAPELTVATAPIDRTLRLPATPVSVRAARELAEEAAAAYGLDEMCTYEFKLAASEAVANAIEHGLPCDDGRIGMHVHDQFPGCLTLSVCDCGSFIHRQVDLIDMPERGRGLEVIAVLMDEFEVLPRTAGTAVRMRKRRRP